VKPSTSILACLPCRYRNLIITVIISQLLQSCIAALADKSRHPPFNDRLPPHTTKYLKPKITLRLSSSRLTALLGPCLSNAARDGGPVMFIVQVRFAALSPMPRRVINARCTGAN
jgi:hypothetical protein